MSSELPLVKCKFEMPKSAETTVGDLFFLYCQPSASTPLVPLKENVQIRFDKADQKHSLKVAKLVKSDSNEFTLEVFSHRAGVIENLQFDITDGATTYRAEPLNLPIMSVLQPGDQMHPLFGPQKLIYPVWIWIVLMLVLVLATLIPVTYQRRRRVRRQLLFYTGEDVSLNDLAKVQNAQAYSQFNRDIRALQKRVDSLSELEARKLWLDIDNVFRAYLMWELVIPVYSRSEKQIMADVKAYHLAIYESIRKDLQRVLHELERGREQGQRITMSDCRQVYQLVRSVGVRIYQTRKTGRAS